MAHHQDADAGTVHVRHDGEIGDHFRVSLFDQLRHTPFDFLAIAARDQTQVKGSSKT